MTDSGLNFGHVKTISNEIQSGHSIAHWKDIRTIFDFHEDFEHRKPQQPAHIKSFAQKVRSAKETEYQSRTTFQPKKITAEPNDVLLGHVNYQIEA
ncbi:hypothetical protein EUGRSUZ_I00180 [Eucalyptus grandis]|uniref:Uncharacterized protein n=2 Tax=Eucalyptus grandis TaxID=71139 RepID=A0ACC3JAX9_EUCGR|nr:hypothetical protein EUGRSUZ_I00180 [Eucalyptus grandis]